MAKCSHPDTSLRQPSLKLLRHTPSAAAANRSLVFAVPGGNPSCPHCGDGCARQF